MPQADTEFPLPPWRHTANSELRRVGIELEMNGMDIDRLAHLCAAFLGGSVEQTSRYERTLTGDPAGNWIVELDFHLLKRLGREQRSNKHLSDDIMTSAEDLLKWVADSLVPLELVSPPLPMDRLSQVNQLIAHLRNAGAKGTADRLTNAFGMQFNPEMPDTSADTISAYLKAFLCLYDWLHERANINMTRLLTSYVDPFPASYRRKVISLDYWPQQAQLIDDYLLDNPTRNRALDMLPLFKHLDAPRVARRTDSVLINPRPTLHYRLPDCLIDQPGWGLHIAWNDWLEVEYLAADRTRLNDCCRAYATHLDLGLGRLFDNWSHQVARRWLRDSP